MVVSEVRADPGERAGERFEAFYVREYHGVVRLAYVLSGSRLAAEDIAQDVFLRAYLDWPRIRHPAACVLRVDPATGRVLRGSRCPRPPPRRASTGSPPPAAP